MGILGKIFGSKAPDRHWSDPDVYEAKQKLFEQHLGPPHDRVLAAIIGWGMGGPVDLWVFPARPGHTVLTTMQLVWPGRTPQKRSSLGKYELAAATRHAPVDGEYDPDNLTEWDRATLDLRGILTNVAYYAETVVIEPLQTAEIPEEDGSSTGLIFDALIGADGPESLLGDRVGVLLCVRVHPAELAHAREHGVASLIDRLRAAGVYPCSDLDREPVV